MSPARRIAFCTVVLTSGLAAQAALEQACRIERPPLNRPLAALPLRLGDWVGRDEPVDPAILGESQADDYLNRVYENPHRRGGRMSLWINYSKIGNNMRHSPEICLPSGGWTKVESQCKTLPIDRPEAPPQPISRLVYSQGELVQSIGFWYYIFGEGQLDRFVRGLPITSRSSHGRTTRGSGMTVEVFCSGESDPEGLALADFSRELLTALEPVLPASRVSYFQP